MPAPFCAFDGKGALVVNQKPRDLQRQIAALHGIEHRLKVAAVTRRHNKDAALWVAAG